MFDFKLRQLLLAACFCLFVAGQTTYGQPPSKTQNQIQKITHQLGQAASNQALIKG